MDESAEGPPVVSLPERVDRKLRLGPFASARDALKFLTYVAVGAIAVPFTSPYLWLGVVAGAFALCVVRSDGQALDERAASFLLWKFRAGRRGTRVTRGPAGDVSRHRLLGMGPERYLAIVRVGGTPVTYLPPVELARRFELFRELLRSIGGRVAFLVTSDPMRAGPVRAAPVGPDRGDAAASVGYAELVVLLCRRRRVRRVYIALHTESAGADAISDLEVRTTTLAERLRGLGLRPTRLEDRGLADAARRWGWS